MRASARFEGAFQRTFSYGVTDRGLLGGGSLRIFAVAKEMRCSGMSKVAASAFKYSSASFVTGGHRGTGWAFSLAVKLLAFRQSE